MGGLVQVETPAPFLAARELMARVAGQKPLAGRLMAYQLALAATYGLRIGEDLLVVLGFWRHGDGLEELFMGCGAPELLAPHIMPLQRAGRLIVRQRMHTANVDRCVAWVSREAGSPGGRLARAAGFWPSGSVDPPGAFLLMEIRN